MHLTRHRSDNHGRREGDGRIELVVLHFTGMEHFDEARDRLCDPVAEVSCHYLIGRDGTVLQMVDEARRAWHAGAGAWGGREDVNSRSIGIEIDNDGRSPFAEPAIAALLPLLADILARHRLPPKAVIGHQCMAPARKDDPGPLFDWKRLAGAGLSVWPDAPHAAPLRGAPADGSHWRQFVEAARAFGYPEDVPGHALHRAFRHRFRGDEGPFDAMDTALLMDLARRHPADRA